jgi:hypothetical protein
VPTASFIPLFNRSLLQSNGSHLHAMLKPGSTPTNNRTRLAKHIHRSRPDSSVRRVFATRPTSHARVIHCPRTQRPRCLSSCPLANLRIRRQHNPFASPHSHYDASQYVTPPALSVSLSSRQQLTVSTISDLRCAHLGNYLRPPGGNPPLPNDTALRTDRLHLP